MWQKARDVVQVDLPVNFNAETMYGFIHKVVDEQRDAKCGEVTFDFCRLNFIEPVGVVVLSNLIEYLRRLGVRVRFAYPSSGTKATYYLDDAGFFQRYVGRQLIKTSAALRSTTMPLNLIHSSEATGHLYLKMMPWVAASVHQTAASLATLRACLEEVFHNVRDHSGVDIGCTFAQHFPHKGELQIAVSDFGDGIPDVVRRVRPEIDDPDAIKLACQEGFTTKTQQWNRGAGLPNLIRFVVLRNGGTVLIASGRGSLAATLSGERVALRARTVNQGWYPGTLVRVILRTDRLPELADDVEPEEFSWS